MTWVKVCGLRTAGDVESAEAAGADAIGLVLIEASPRHVDAVAAASLAAAARLPAIVLTDTGRPEDVPELVERIGAAGVQPYGPAAEAVAQAAVDAGLMVLRPHQVVAPVALGDFPAGQIPLLDGFSADAMGGTGVLVDRKLLPEGGTHFVLAGGLGPDNVAAAVQEVRPWGVDASSGLESSPGVKDPARIRAFVERAKDA